MTSATPPRESTSGLKAVQLSASRITAAEASRSGIVSKSGTMSTSLTRVGAAEGAAEGAAAAAASRRTTPPSLSSTAASSRSLRLLQLEMM